MHNNLIELSEIAAEVASQMKERVCEYVRPGDHPLLNVCFGWG
jgi:hypothetical protein